MLVAPKWQAGAALANSTLATAPRDVARDANGMSKHLKNTFLVFFFCAHACQSHALSMHTLHLLSYCKWRTVPLPQHTRFWKDANFAVFLDFLIAASNLDAFVDNFSLVFLFEFLYWHTWMSRNDNTIENTNVKVSEKKSIFSTMSNSLTVHFYLLKNQVEICTRN